MVSVRPLTLRETVWSGNCRLVLFTSNTTGVILAFVVVVVVAAAAVVLVVLVKANMVFTMNETPTAILMVTETYIVWFSNIGYNNNNKRESKVRTRWVPIKLLI